MSRALLSIPLLLLLQVACDGASDPQLSWAGTLDWSRPSFDAYADNAWINDVATMRSRARIVDFDNCDILPATTTWRVKVREGDYVGETFAMLGVDGRPVQGCDVRWQAPFEGPFRIEASTDGQLFTAEVAVRDIWLASMGDSFSSGEGNPDLWMDNDDTWRDARCHRSVAGWPSKAAQIVQNDHPDAQVLLTFLACSGASIADGVLGSYGGAEPGPTIDPQLDVASGIVLRAGQDAADWLQVHRSPDHLLVTASGNDIGFADIVTDSLILGPSDDLLFEMEFNLYTAQLRLYDLHLAVSESPLVTRDAHGDPVMSTMLQLDYADPTRGDDGEFDACWTDNSFFMTDGDMQILYEEVVLALNDTIASESLEAGTTLVPIAELYDTHGVCASEPWFRFPADSFWLQGDSRGTYHPTEAGHAAMATEAVDAMSLGARSPFEPEWAVPIFRGDSPWDRVFDGDVRQAPLTLRMEPRVGMNVSFVVNDVAYADQDQIVLDQPGVTEITLRRSWSGPLGASGAIPLPDATFTVVIEPSGAQVLQGLSATVRTATGATLPLVTDDPDATVQTFSGEVWLAPVSVEMEHSNPAASLVVQHTSNTGSGDVTTAYTGDPLAPVWGIRQQIDTAVEGLETAARARVEVTILEPEDWPAYALDGVTIRDAADSDIAAVYTGASATPDDISGTQWTGYDFQPALGSNWAAQGFALRVDGVPQTIDALVSTDAVSVELIGCFNRLADCAALNLDPEGSAVLQTYALPPGL